MTTTESRLGVSGPFHAADENDVAERDTSLLRRREAAVVRDETVGTGELSGAEW